MQMFYSHRRFVDFPGQDEDSAYIAEVPELPGCAADGETYQKALENAEVIIKECIETAVEIDRPIPIPKGKLMYA